MVHKVPVAKSSQSKSFDPSGYDRPSVTVDLVLMSVVDGAPAALLMRRDNAGGADRWALPVGFVGMGESLDAAARRVLTEKARMHGAYVEQLYTFGDPGRDPRARIISVAYFALLPCERFARAVDGVDGLALAPIVAPDGGGAAVALSAAGEPLPLAFDHGDMLALAVKRLRGRLDYSPIALALLPERFTLRALQEVHEAVLGRSLNKAAFRRRMLDTGWLDATGEREAGTSYRPPELYRARAADRTTTGPAGPSFPS
ncbi:NUDIX hydrolase [Sphingomonas gellani]|nr:NUDIX domain-containing protein [Sphingomonas gellani]